MVKDAISGYILLAVLSLGLASLLPAHGKAIAAAGAPLYMYQQVFAPFDGRTCPSFPVCSLYARQAFAAHGLLIGSWLMLDRLIHEADDVHLGQWLLAVDGKRLYDPLKRNDFWLNSARPSDLNEQEHE